ncbi:hypothetical protein [Nostoc sp.]|uniref:hypothetical protein n=1 Tax=Nostoc sp. TaxID=1180 RepID=UPI002FF65559
MTLAIVAETDPLKANEDGMILMGKTSVTLDTVVAVFKQGATAEEIVILPIKSKVHPKKAAFKGRL